MATNTNTTHDRPERHLKADHTSTRSYLEAARITDACLDQARRLLNRQSPDGHPMAPSKLAGEAFEAYVRAVADERRAVTSVLRDIR